MYDGNILIIIYVKFKGGMNNQFFNQINSANLRRAVGMNRTAPTGKEGKVLLESRKHRPTFPCLNGLKFPSLTENTHELTTHIILVKLSIC